ncbi:MAG: tyrosine-type recombinase/integrase [Proteobacteria bacterium]|nr:tyrosine-type recombinase/integrase [Pseudomonadota bacterium]
MPKADRTRRDYRLWALRFADEFKDDPAAMFEERESRAEVNDWRARWKHSPKQYDYAGTVVTRILNWARDDAGKIRDHHCERFRKVYQADRADIVWTPADREAIDALAPLWVRRILTAACETGLRPGDLIRLSRSHIEATPKGRRIKVRTNKRKRTATIPVTPAMATLIDSTPKDRMLILVNASGRALTEHRASEGLRQWRDKAELSGDLRLQDARGTAATRLLNADLSLAEIASHMGWSVRHAAAVIEHYARVSPDESDAVLTKLARAKGAEA